jgi:hypothetical protein
MPPAMNGLGLAGELPFVNGRRLKFYGLYGRRMKHITFGDKSLLIGDAAADALLNYGAFLTSEGRGDTVKVHAISSDGDEVTASFLLGPGVTMMAETTYNRLPEPDNSAALDYMERAQKRPIVTTSEATDDILDSSSYDETYELGAPPSS